ncbi:hypothetical protein [Natrinema pallidum]|uniref:Uncharacterized protein n=1 Tax=Natrinema pallidum TaxID=69527 RepID=A0A4V1IF31_9EURY|nr:hypothetical protein [Natrinema pallidum]QCW03574.1 hypothetical protein FGF80_10120 [Natrinema pallidum]
MQQSTAWTIAGAVVDGGVETTTIEAQPTGSVELRCLFETETDEMPASGRQYYRHLRQYLEYVHTVQTGETHTGEVWVQEEANPNDPVSSHIVDVVPGQGVRDIDPFWGVIVGGSDDSRGLPDYRDLTLELVWIAPRSAYADRAAVEAAVATAPIDIE